MEKNHSIIKSNYSEKPYIHLDYQTHSSGHLDTNTVFKFSAAEESVYIFSTLGAEPYGRIGSGVIELVASILILIPRTTLLGALLAAGTMAGAILSHLVFLGIEIKNDGGTLFILAIITFLCCLILVFNQKEKIPALLHFKM